MQTLRDIFIKNLKFYRKQKSITQEKLSELINMSPSYINAIETKSSFPQPEIIEKIAEALSIPAYDFFKYDACPENAMCFDPENFAETVSESICEKLRHNIYQDILNVINLKIK